MCNLYSITRNQEAMRRLFRIGRDLTGNLPALPAVYPDTMTPVVCVARDGVRELFMMHWGFPPPPNRHLPPINLQCYNNRQRYMSDDIYFDGIKYISAKEAASLSGFTRDYVARLCRHGKVNARRLGALWYIDVVSLLEFLSKRASPTT
jgi:Helix-turn-helix domain